MSGTADTPRDLVTGATGMLGSHIAERLIAAGRRVRAIVRPGSDTRFLQALGVECQTGDLTDPESCARAVRGVDVVYHAAAKVGDWGPWREFQAGCIDATRNIAEASARGGGGRLPPISSAGADGHPAGRSPPVGRAGPGGQKGWGGGP